MERLKEAVEKARQQRDTLYDLAENTVTLNTSTTPKPATDVKQGITYTQTKKISVPKNIYEKKRIIAGYDDPTVIASYKLLRTQVLRRMKDNSWNTLAVTSTSAGEGKTLTSINLAISIAREVNHTVLLVDLDLRRPSVAPCFDYQPEFGISDYLEHNVPLSEILVNPELERLVVLPGREAVLHSSETLSSPKMVNLVEEIKTRYPSRIIIFDMPPMLIADDVLAFSPYVDAFLLVVEEGKTKRDDLTRSVELLSNYNILGTVLNKSTETMHNYY
jgi:capsular exopolysaccharide synthesis family protein